MYFSHFILASLLAPIGKIAADKMTTESTKVIDIGTRRPEGIDIVPNSDALDFGLGEGTIAIRGEMLWAGIEAVNVDTGERRQIVKGTETINESMVMGVHYHRGMIWVAGGGPQLGATTAIPEVRLYDPTTGILKLSCLPNNENTSSNFMNDMAFVDGKVYITNSFLSSIMVLDEEAALSGECVVDAIETDVEFFPPTEFGANGIVPYNNGLIIAQRTSGAVYFLDLINDNALSVLLPVNTSVTADGFVISPDDTLYLAENINEKSESGLISVWQLGKDDDNQTTIELRGNLLSPDYDSPATLALDGDTLYTVNGRFISANFLAGVDTEAGFDERFQIVAVDRLDFDENLETDDAAVDVDAASTSSPSSATLSFVGMGRTCIVWSILAFGAYLTI